MSSAKDLGITISHDLSWSLHVVEVVNKANKVLGLIKRTISSVNKEIFSTLYKALVRPILKYASPVWCPNLVKIILLEKVQRRASQLALGGRRGEMSYKDRCEMSQWSKLTDRRLYFSLIECYKLVFGLNSLCFPIFLSSLQNVPGPITTTNYKLNRLTAIVINTLSLLKLFVNGMTCLPMLLR